ncbi:transposon Tf2-6 polyprotein [Trichonephila clavipes]|nr:transposon Tf2-6 polyprotein [Trichonephila clavipes]
MEQQIADLLRQNKDLIRALQIRDDSHSHKVTVQFDKFDEENENFDSFIERFETYLDVQNVPIANRAKVFVSSLSAKLYQLLKNLLAPDIPSDQTVRTVPFALKGRVENEIDRLEKEGNIEKVDSSEWATPVVPVVKSDGSIRLCADYSVTLNPNVIVPQHPLPRLDEIFGSLNGGKQFTKLDFKHAYLQMKVHPDSSDASPVGIVCVCVWLCSVTRISRWLNVRSRSHQELYLSEKKYSQIDKEALSIVWAVRKFYLYLKGRRFTLITDHKPLIAIFGSKRGLPVLAATRLLHYALILQSFEFDIIFRKTIEHGNADFLSRLPKTSEELEVKDDITIFQMSQIEALPVTSKELRQETSKDIELGPLLRALREGKDLQGREAQYTIEDGLLCTDKGSVFQGNFEGRSGRITY